MNKEEGQTCTYSIKPSVPKGECQKANQFQLEQPDFKDKAVVPNDNKFLTIKEEAFKIYFK